MASSATANVADQIHEEGKAESKELPIRTKREGTDAELEREIWKEFRSRFQSSSIRHTSQQADLELSQVEGEDEDITDVDSFGPSAQRFRAEYPDLNGAEDIWQAYDDDTHSFDMTKAYVCEVVRWSWSCRDKPGADLDEGLAVSDGDEDDDGQDDDSADSDDEDEIYVDDALDAARWIADDDELDGPDFKTLRAAMASKRKDAAEKCSSTTVFLVWEYRNPYGLGDSEVVTFSIPPMTLLAQIRAERARKGVKDSLEPRSEET